MSRAGATGYAKNQPRPPVSNPTQFYVEAMRVADRQCQCDSPQHVLGRCKNVEGGRDFRGKKVDLLMVSNTAAPSPVVSDWLLLCAECRTHRDKR